MRASSQDLMQNFRFHVTAQNSDSQDPLALTRENGFGGSPQAGFQSVTLPELSVEATEYREGTFIWTQKYPGIPTVSDCTLMRGISKGDTKFHDWAMSTVNGKQYRCDVTIWHYQRTEMSMANKAEVSDDVRHVDCFNCFPIRAKTGDLDSTSGEVTMAECDFAVESFTMPTDLQSIFAR